MCARMHAPRPTRRVALCARAAGAATVTITDMVEAKLKKAVEIGCAFAINADTPGIVGVMEANIGDKFDKTFECCGVVSALDVCVKACASGGTMCICIPAMCMPIGAPTATPAATSPKPAADTGTPETVGIAIDGPATWMSWPGPTPSGHVMSCAQGQAKNASVDLHACCHR